MARLAMFAILCLAEYVVAGATNNLTSAGGQPAGSNHSIKVDGLAASEGHSAENYDTAEEEVESPGAMLRGWANGSAEGNAALPDGAKMDVDPVMDPAVDAFAASNLSSHVVGSRSSCHWTCSSYCRGGAFLSWCRSGSCYCQCGRSQRVGSCGGKGLFCKYQCSNAASWAGYSWCMNSQCWCYARRMQVVGRC